jgi:ribulose-5-phosphate 4-epimerase/fuculose-1-phosphate aldolase
MKTSNLNLVQRELVAKACRILGKLELAKAGAGHVSQRIGDDQILIRARGPDELGVRFTTADQVVSINLNGDKLDGADGLTPPQEVFLHTCIYRSRPDVKSVVHVHPAAPVLLTICNIPLRMIYGAYDSSSLDLLFEGIPTYDRSVLIADGVLGQDFAEAIGHNCACLMRAHGITTVGSTVEEATITAIRLNELAEMNYRAHLLGGARDIDPQDADFFRQNAGKSRLASNVASTWRYYAALTSE